MQLTFLGTGTSFGVPQIGCDCAVCHSADARDQRTRSAALVRSADATILIDTPPELRLQLLAAGVRHIDAVLYTHEHADHVNGIDDLRMFSVRDGRPLPVYGPPETLDRLREGFRYIFDDSTPPFLGTSKPSLQMHPLEPGEESLVAGMTVLPLAFEHGHLRVFGYRFGSMAYLTDVKSVPREQYDHLRGLDVLALNALWWRAHPTHLSITEAVDIARELGVTRTYLTHLTHETGHEALSARLPAGVFPAYDGLTVEAP